TRFFGLDRRQDAFAGREPRGIRYYSARGERGCDVPARSRRRARTVGQDRPILRAFRRCTVNRIDWYVEGIEFGSCNCIYACPCQSEAFPTYGDCRGFEVVRIDRGHFGDVSLDGLKIALLYAWPGPIFEGRGEMQVVVDERADSRQRQALTKIVNGE